MPIYEYNCDKCGVFEVTQRITENPLKKCPTCKGKVERIISATSFVLKGSGWYATDYARSGSSKSETKSEGATDSANGASGGSDSKETSGNGSATAKSTSDSGKSTAEKSSSKAAD
jgi:putative FmdB family regulatory protein